MFSWGHGCQTGSFSSDLIDTSPALFYFRLFMSENDVHNTSCIERRDGRVGWGRKIEGGDRKMEREDED